MSAKKVKVKVTKKKLKVKNLLVTLVILMLLILVGIDITRLPVKNIYISGNNILNDKTIIELADLTNYPPYLNTYFSNIKKKLLENEYIKSVNIKRTLSRKIYIEIEEYNPICIYAPNEVDKERFLLYMIDSNYVYITLSKIDKINKYNSIVQELDNKKGIIYLDSGDYVEIKG